MTQQQLRALVVDDEPAARWLASQALRKRSFDCREAADGQEALGLLSQQKFDLVVTDLRMPQRNGHSLAVEILALSGVRPVLIVLTGVIEPRLAEDLLLRGVDNIEFKPVDFALFAAKARALCDRRLAASARQEDARQNHPSAPPTKIDRAAVLTPVTESVFVDRLQDMAAALVIPAPAIEVGKVSRGGNLSERRVAATIAPDRELTGELLQLANSSYYSASSREVTALRDAVARLGVRRFAAHAQMSAMIRALLAKTPAWFDRDVVLQRCFAAMMAVGRLCRQATIEFSNSDLPPLTLAYPARRLVLAAMFPERYESFRILCEQSGPAMRDLEESVFPMSAAQALGKLLVQTGLAPDTGELLQRLDAGCDAAQERGSLTRQTAELLHAGEVLGRLAVGHWDPWDSCQMVQHATLHRFDVSDPQEFVKHVRSDVKLLLKTAKDDLHTPVMHGRRYFKEQGRKFLFFHLEYHNHGLVSVLLRSLGLEPLSLSLGESSEEKRLVLSGVGLQPQAPVELLDLAHRCRDRMQLLFLVDRGQTARFEPLGTCVEMPCSIAALCRSLEEFLSS